MTHRTTRFFTPGFVGAVALLAACSNLEQPTALAPDAHIIPGDDPEIEFVALCKAGPPGTYTFQATASHPLLLNEATGVYDQTSGTYTVTVTATSKVDGTTIDGACYRYTSSNGKVHDHIALTGGNTDGNVNVVETGMPFGLVFQKADVYLETRQPDLTRSTTQSTTTTNSVDGKIGGNGAGIAWGSTLVFYDVPAPGLSASKTATASYDIPVTWDLAKSVSPTSHSGAAGQVAGTSTWTVTATRTEGAPTNHVVSGTITVTNPAGGITRTFSVTDQLNTGTNVAVTCPKNTIDPGESVDCTYTASEAGVTLNTATISTAGMPDVQATAAVTYSVNYTGDQTVTLADPRFTYSTSISGSSTVTFNETFSCPSDPTRYTNGTYTRTETNTATLKGVITDLSRSASVTVTCTMPIAETATGAGLPWAATVGAPSNWFMYTPWVTTGGYRGISAAASGNTPAGTDLIAGQNMIAGRITGTRSTTTSITITLNSAFKFGASADNVKIYPMSCTTAQAYVQPGKFTVKRTASVAASSITVTGLSNTACYGIHVSVTH